MNQLVLAIAIGILSIQACAAPEQVNTSSVEDTTLDSRTYCRALSKAKGGDYRIEEECLIEEYQAEKSISSMQVPSEMAQKCRKIAQDAGGSYQVMEACIQKEIKVKIR